MENHKTDYQIRAILQEHPEGGFQRQGIRHETLIGMVEDLRKRGYSRRWEVKKIGKRDVTRLVHDWRESGLSPRTIANRLLDIRWLAAKLGRESEIPSNRDLGLPLNLDLDGPPQAPPGASASGARQTRVTYKRRRVLCPEASNES